MSQLCTKHFKHLEAFCSEDLQLLCINCILHEGHKSHQFNALSDAVQLEKMKFGSTADKVNQDIDSNVQVMHSIQQHMDTIIEYSEQQIKEIGVFFHEMRIILDDREQQMKSKVQETFNKDQAHSKAILLQVQQIQSQLKAYQNENSFKSDDCIEYLNRAPRRHDILESMRNTTIIPEMKTRIPEMNREAETNYIIKQLLNLKITAVQKIKCNYGEWLQFQLKATNQQQKKQPQPPKAITMVKKQPVPQQKKIEVSTVKKQALIDNNYSNFYLIQNQQKNIVSVNLSKRRDQQENKVPQSKSYRLTNLQDARKQFNKQGINDNLANSCEYKSNSPRLNTSHSRHKHNTSDLSLHSLQENQITRDMSANRIMDESFKQDFGIFMNSQIYEKNDFSQICHNMKFDFLILGGFVESNTFWTERYDPQSEKSQMYDQVNVNRTKFGTALLMNGNILIIGGKQDGMRVASCEEYQVKERKCSSSSIKLNSSRSGFGVIANLECIYVIGGNDANGSLNIVDVYDQYKKVWIRGPMMNERREEFGITMGLDNCIYAVGGFGGLNNTCLSSCEKLDLQRNKWEPIPSMSISRRALSVVSLPDGLYAIGGFNGSQYLRNVERYDDQMNRWVEIAQIQFARCTFSAVITHDNQYIYIFGGFDNEPLDKVERYNIMSESWELCPSLLSKRFMHQSVMVPSINNKIKIKN